MEEGRVELVPVVVVFFRLAGCVMDVVFSLILPVLRVSLSGVHRFSTTPFVDGMSGNRKRKKKVDHHERKPAETVSGRKQTENYHEKNPTHSFSSARLA